MSFRQGFCYPAFQSSLSLDEVCREAAAIGYKGIELWGWDDSLLEFVATAKKHGLVVPSVVGHESISHGLNDDSQHDRIEAELRRSIDKAHELAIDGVICFSGERHPAKTDLEGLANLIKGVRRVVEYAEEKGVNLNLELLNSRVDHPGYQADKVDYAIAACEGVASPRFKILFDIYHVQIMEGDIIRNLLRALPYIGHIHTAGNPGRHELDDAQELNYRAIARAIHESGYTGFVAHEFFTGREDKVATLREAFKTCDVTSG